MIRIAAMSQWSVRYYESTAVRGDEYAGGLSEYYSERDTRAPIVMVAGDREFARESMGIEHGGSISAEEVTAWFSDAVPPGGERVGKARPGTPGWDVLFTVPKSVSVMMALTPDRQMATAMLNAVAAAADDAMGYLHQHAGYTRVCNPHDPSKKDLQRLPALPFVAYVHHTARPVEDGTCDPHMHIHALLPGKIARADGRLVAPDSQSLYHESKAAGMIFQKIMRDRATAAVGAVWGPVDPHTGIAELRGFDPVLIKAYSRRTSLLMDWAKENPEAAIRDAVGEESDGAGEAKPSREWLDVAQKATRHKKLESLHYDELRQQWQREARASHVDLNQCVATAEELAISEPGRAPAAGAVFELLGSLKNSWTRADMVEAVVGLWEPGNGLIADVDDIEAVVDDVIAAGCFQIVEDRQSWHREGHVRYTDGATLVREAEVLEMCGVKSAEFEITTSPDWFTGQGLEATAAKAMYRLATSKRFVNVLEAPAGSGKTTSLAALRKRAEAQRKRVVLLSTQRKAINAAQEKDAASEYATIAQATYRIDHNTLDWDRNTVVVIDEAAMTGDRELHAILGAALKAKSKVILVGDSYQLQPVLSAGGLFRDLSEQLPWTQTFGHVWRQKDVEEKAMTLTMRTCQTESEVRQVAHWYATHDRLAAGDELSMSDQLVRDYFDEVLQDRDVLVMADQWKRADPLNTRIQNIYRIAMQRELGHELATVPVARDQHVNAGDIIITTANTRDITLRPNPETRELTAGSIVTNADRWRILDVGADGSIDAMRIGDKATATLPADYARKHVVLGYVSTMHANQGSTANVGLAIGDADTMQKVALYPGMTRGDLMNKMYMTVTAAGEDDHHTHSDVDTPPARIYTRDEAQELFEKILRRDDREQTALAGAEEALNALARGDAHADHADAFGGVNPYVAQLVHTRAGRREMWAQEEVTDQRRIDALVASIDKARDRGREVSRDAERSRVRGRDSDYDGLEL
ncbi:MAG: MobF family relaxase [Mycolicibacterium sp.]|uniref:MobF family relaxase n=1 Tax=Mycolicibacterium sp. TaxID=2320850 RepID=UPI003D0F4771